jgi:hypothetical protein
MNDNSRSALSWLGAAAFVVVAFGSIAVAYFMTRPSTPADTAYLAQQLQLRRELEVKAQAALTQPGRNADGTYRVPIDQAMALLAADNTVFAKFRTQSQPTK